MSFTNDPVNSLTDRVRLIVGDTMTEIEYLSDEVYVFLLDKYANNVTAASLEASRYILGSLSKYSRQRTGDIEVYGAEMFKNYRDFLRELLRNPQMLFDRATIYAGGISKSDMKKNDRRSDNVAPTVYKGMTTNTRIYDKDYEDGDSFF